MHMKTRLKTQWELEIVVVSLDTIIISSVASIAIVIIRIRKVPFSYYDYDACVVLIHT